jgi:glutamate-1-semialdehyde 2,1-aminomutase
MNQNKYRERLHNVIPGGAHTYSRGDDQFPANAPALLDRGIGAYVWDPDGNKFLDYGMGLRAITLGYAHPQISEAVSREILKGNNLTRASMTELEAAELLVDLIPSAEMVKFAKNGSNVTTAAAKIARAFTGKTYICVPRQQPFFSFDDWFIGTTAIKRGIPNEHVSTTLVFDYGDISTLERLFEKHPNQIAGVMLEPATTILPCPKECNSQITYDTPCRSCKNFEKNFLTLVQKLCKQNGALLIFDEMITGFRWHLQGAQTYFGVEPDLSTFGKAMANGYSLAAVAGKREIMNVGAINSQGAERTFLLSTTHGGEMISLRAFIETVSVYKAQDVCRHLWTYGAKLREGLLSAAATFGLGDYFSIEGATVLMNYVTRDKEFNISLPFRTLFNQELIRQGVLMPWISASLAHTNRELELTISAASKAFEIYARALNDGIDKYLVGPAVKPVFRQFN